MKRVALLGATGSIGASALDVIGRHPDRLRLTVATAHTDVSGLVDVCRNYGSKHAVIADPDRLPALREALASASPSTVAHGGPAALAEWAASPVVDSVVAGIVGTAGLPSVLAAANAGKTLLLANKESLVMAGSLLLEAARHGGANIVPLDSEHNALYQCMAGGRAGVTGVDLTASGGPFLGRDRDALAAVTVEQACAHPIWKMGRKISVDSATLMNKGLEVIEAQLLFSIPASDIGVVIHPQSLVHALVHYRDGSTIAHLGQPDMRVAIAHALGLPERIDSGVGRLDLVAAGRLEFQAPDLESFRCLGLAFAALAAGYDAPLVLNAANEVAVEAFLQGELGFLGIDAVIADCLDRCVGSSLPSDFEELNARDAAVRRYARRRISSHHKVAA